METVRIIRIPVWLLTIAVTSLFAACDISDTGVEDTEIQNTLTSQQEVILSKGVSRNNQQRGEFYPLAIGNSWTYSGESSISMGGFEPCSISVTEKRSIVGIEELFDREYILEKQEIEESSRNDIVTYWYRYRQDRAGLYEADVAVNDPPVEDYYRIGPSHDNLDPDCARWTELWQQLADKMKFIDSDMVERARIVHFNKISVINELLGRNANEALLTSGPPGGILPDEIQRLKYPLHPRQEWIIRDAPLFYSVVESHEVLDLPAGMMSGFKIRIYNEFLDDDDIVYFWYGRRGFLGMDVHLETEMFDSEGNSYGTVISDEDLFLDSYNLVKQEREVEKPGQKDCIIG